MNKRNYASLILILLIALGITAEEENKTTQIVDEYLILGPVEVNKPIGGPDDKLQTLLSDSQLNIIDWWPSKDYAVNVYDGQKLVWKAEESSRLELRETEQLSIYYVGFYVDVNRFSEIKIEGETCHLAALFLNGQKQGDKTSFNENGNDECEAGKISSDLKLENGKHFILVKLLFDPSQNSEWSFSSSITTENEVTITSYPTRSTTVSDLLDNKKVTSISVSPNGDLVALGIKERNDIKDEYENWIQLHKVSDGSSVWTFRGAMSVPEVDWAPDSKSFCYTTTSDENKTLWIVDLEHGTTEPLIENVERMGGFEWAPNGEFITYTTSEKYEPSDKDFKKYDLPEDRWPGFKNKTSLHRVFIKSKMTQQLTEPDQKFSFGEISPDSKKILFTKTYYGEEKRPYSRSDYYILDLVNVKADSIMSLYYSAGASWSPDSKQLLVLGGPTTFGEIGKNVPEGILPNDYDTQAYIFDIESNEVKAITKIFDPQISSAKWDGEKNVIYFRTTDQSYKKLYKYYVDKDEYQLIDLGIESLDGIDFAENFSFAILKGSSSNISEKVYKLDLQNEEVSLFLDTETEQYADIKLGDVKDWDFTSQAGEKIKGRVYYPPDFEESKKYPAIVYYYAGTSPVTREFEGRYPKNYWAANGYVVYVLQPSGATGFGQEFSAKHVNDWGETTAKEIIEGTKKFLDAHKFVDPDGVGCIGASYGGFETMTLITKTDIFSAAISHAGISNLTSYWGVGYWGYLYITRLPEPKVFLGMHRKSM
ncbi:MAG: prolyl oligopeptidase family serine peptidase [Melioribacteraceae bacterium]|nr:prolyl oligopeptidase family serine peptidase [Melioribacteraceae bacterium]